MTARRFTGTNCCKKSRGTQSNFYRGKFLTADGREWTRMMKGKTDNWIGGFLDKIIAASSNNPLIHKSGILFYSRSSAFLGG
jgi:hypothetical protein